MESGNIDNIRFHKGVKWDQRISAGILVFVEHFQRINNFGGGIIMNAHTKSNLSSFEQLFSLKTTNFKVTF